MPTRRAGLLLAATAAIVVFSLGWTARSEIASRSGAFLIGATYHGRTGVTMQAGEVDCGAAALSMIFRAHGLRESALDSLRNAVIARDSGLSFLEMQGVAQSHGLPAQGFLLTIDQLSRSPLPAIAHFPGHFVVVDSVTHDGLVAIRDPALGRVTMSKERFGKRWTGRALLFQVTRS